MARAFQDSGHLYTGLGSDAFRKWLPPPFWSPNITRLLQTAQIFPIIPVIFPKPALERCFVKEHSKAGMAPTCRGQQLLNLCGPIHTGILFATLVSLQWPFPCSGHFFFCPLPTTRHPEILADFYNAIIISSFLFKNQLKSPGDTGRNGCCEGTGAGTVPKHLPYCSPIAAVLYQQLQQQWES